MHASQEQFHRLIDGSKQFIIPVFQRDYAWEEPQFERFWNDIHQPERSPGQYEHFLGTFVYVEEESLSAGFSRWLVIDGQQRLTTLSILFAALKDVCKQFEKDSNPIESIPSSSQLEDKFLINDYVPPNVDDKRKLILRGSDNELLKSLLLDEGAVKQESSKITDAYTFFKEKIECLDHDSITNLYTNINNLMVVGVRLDPRIDNPQLVFESLNSTGVQLSQTDLIRNFILMSAQPDEEQRRLYEQYWQKIEKLYKDDLVALNEFARDYLAMRIKATKNIKADQVYEIFKRWYGEALGNTFEDLEAVLVDLVRYATCYAAFRIGNHSTEAVNTALSDVKRISTAVGVLIFQLYDRYEYQETLNEDELIKCLRHVESYLVRRSACNRHSGAYWSNFLRISQRLSEENGEILDSFIVQLVTLSERAQLPKDEEFKNALLTGDMYFPKVIRPLLERLENADPRNYSEQSKERTSMKKLSIEHILPQNKNLDISWQEMLGEKWSDIQKEVGHQLGNLTLTGYNTLLSDRGFTEKKTMEDGFQDSPLKLNQYVKEQTEWTQTQISTRSAELTNQALQIWPYPKVDSAALKREKERNLVRQSTGRTPEDLNISERIKTLFDDLHQEITNLGGSSGSVIAITNKHSVTYYSPEPFIEVIPRKDYLTLLPSLDYEDLDDPSGIAIDARDRTFVTHAANWTGEAIMQIRNFEDLIEASSIIHQAFAEASERTGKI